MPLENSLNQNPYFDDFDETKNFHQVLFRPAVPVQARELNQLQSILQNQIERFGDNIFKSGTIIKGCNFTYDKNYHYVKLRDLRIDLQQNVVENLVGYIAVDEVSGLKAQIINAVNGFETQNPDMKTIYVKYLNTGTGQKKEFAADDTLTFYDSTNTLNSALSTKVVPTTLDGNPTNPVGTGYGFIVSEGIIYQKGYFVRVPDGTQAIVSKYDIVPNGKVVGFETKELIITEDIDESLYDNAQGYTNYNAPGAHRLKLLPTLSVYDVGSIPSENFFVIAEWENGLLVKQNDNSQYNEIGEEFARRTYEESGDYVVKNFVLDTTPANTSHFNLNLSQGLAYIRGYRVEKLNDLSIPVRKGLDTKLVSNQSIVPNFGNYVLVNNLLGSFETNKVPTVSLRDTISTGYANGSFSKTAPGNEIGKAKALSILYDSGTPGDVNAYYRLYLTDIKMNTGKNFSDVRSVYSNTTVTGIANPVLESSKAVLKENNFSVLIYPFGQDAVKTLRDGANNNNQFVYRTASPNVKFLTTGSLGPFTLSGSDQFPYGTGTLNETQETSIIVVPTVSTNVSPAKTGNVSINTVNGAVTGVSTTFLTDYQVGDYIFAATDSAREILSIANDTSMVVQSGFGSNVSNQAHNKTYPANVPIPIVKRNSTITLSNTSSLTITLKNASNATETLSANLDCVIHYDVKKQSAVEIAKEVKKSHYVKIDCSNNAANTLGPWSLGVPDVFKIEGVYLSNTYVESANTDVTSKFTFDSGQRDAYYDLAYLKIKPGSGMVLANTDKLLVKFSAFKPSSSIGQGFYTVDSYPIDDANTANTTAITTASLPIYTSPVTNQQYNLRNAVDFRPALANTAVYANTAASANVNPANTSSFPAVEKYVVSPNLPFTSSLEYYQGRIDKLLLNIYGDLNILEGVPGATPTAPADVDGSMTLGEISVAPYPTLSGKEIAQGGNPTYAVGVNSKQVQRYTMKNLGSMDRRLQNVEYYVTLSLLEKSASEKVFLDSNGFELVKNGIYVEDFDSMDSINFSDSESSVAVDPDETTIRPRIQNGFVGLKVATTSNVTNTANTLTLSYTESVGVQQPVASKKRKIAQVPAWTPTVTTPVDYDPYPDITTPPTVTKSPIPDWVYYLYDGSHANGSLYTGDDPNVTQSQMNAAAKAWWDAAITGTLPSEYATIDGKPFDSVVNDQLFIEYGLTPKSNYYTPT